MNRRTFFSASSSFALTALLGAVLSRSVTASAAVAGTRPLKTPTAAGLTPRGLERQRTAGGGAVHQFPAERPLRPYYAPRANRVIRKKTGRRM